MRRRSEREERIVKEEDHKNSNFAMPKVVLQLTFTKPSIRSLFFFLSLTLHSSINYRSFHHSLDYYSISFPFFPSSDVHSFLFHPSIISSGHSRFYPPFYCLSLCIVVCCCVSLCIVVCCCVLLLLLCIVVCCCVLCIVVCCVLLCVVYCCVLCIVVCCVLLCGFV